MKLNKKLVIGLAMPLAIASAFAVSAQGCKPNPTPTPGPSDTQVKALNEKLATIKATIKDPSTMYAAGVEAEDIEFSLDDEKYEIQVVSLTSNNTVLVVQFKLKEKASGKVSSDVKVETIKGFKEVVEGDIEAILASIKCTKEHKEHVYAKDLTKAEDFTFENLDEERYTVEDFEVKLIDETTVEVKFSIKDATSNKKSSLKTQKITGFKKKENATNDTINKLVDKIKVKVPNKASKTPNQVSADDIEFSGYKETEYSINEEEIKIEKFETSIKITFTISTIEEPIITSKERTVEITGFKKSTGNEQSDLQTAASKVIVTWENNNQITIAEMEEKIKENQNEFYFTFSEPSLEDVYFVEYVSYKKKNKTTVTVTFKVIDEENNLFIEGTCDVAGWKA